jgi:site-specific DNA-methyltransferase (adenine-specific)
MKPGLYNLDCLDGFKKLADRSIDMLLSDWPYGRTGLAWDKKLPLDQVWPEIKRIVKPNGAILLFGQCPYDKVLGVSNLPMLRYEYVWQKSKCTNFLWANHMPLKRTENILVFYNKMPIYNPQFREGKPYNHKGCNKHRISGKMTLGKVNPGFRYPTNLLSYNTESPSESRGLHPTQKPVALCEFLIKTYTQPGEIVLDNCAGSGTTAIAAIRSGRKFIAFEKDPDMFKIAEDRIKQELKDTHEIL